MAEKVEKKPLINQACNQFVFALDKQEERKISPAEYHGQPAVQKNAEKKMRECTNRQIHQNNRHHDTES